MPPAKKLPSNIAKRFKKKRRRDGDDEAYWAEVAEKNSKSTSNNKPSSSSSSTTPSLKSDESLDQAQSQISSEGSSEHASNNGTLLKLKKNIEKKKTKKDEKTKQVTQKKLGPSALFWKSTTQIEWSPDSETSSRSYTVRYVKGGVCTSVPWIGLDSWATVQIPEEAMSGQIQEDENEELILHYVIGVVTCSGDNGDKKKGDIVGIWASDAGDGHVEFYCDKDFKYSSTDFNELSSQLCTEICPELADVFDDGSGIDREPILIASSILSPLSEWYIV